MNKLWSALLASIISWLVLFLKSSSGQGIQVAPISLTSGELFTVTALGPNIPFPLTFTYVLFETVTVESPTTTAVFTLDAINSFVGVINRYRISYIVSLLPTVGGPNSAGISVGPVSQSQQSATVTFIGNLQYPITYTISEFAIFSTSGTLQSGTSTAVFNAPTSFRMLDVTGQCSGTDLAYATITPFVGITVSPSPARIRTPVTVSVTVVANSTDSIIYQLYDANGILTSDATSASVGTTWQFDAPSDVGVYGLSVINGIDPLSAYGFAYTPLSVVPAPVIVQPTPGTLLLAGSSVTASITDYDTASDYTLSLVNGVFAYITTVPGSVSRPVLPVPSNYLGELYLTAVQLGESDVATYTVSVAQAVYNSRKLRRRAHVGK